MAPDLIELGYVARAHGIRGELHVTLHNPDSEVLLGADRVFIGGRAHAVRRARAVPAGVLLAVDGVDDRTAAEALRGAAVSVARELIPLADGEVLAIDLVGCDAVLEDGAPFGRVVAIEVGPQDRLVIRDGALERLLPLVPELVVDIDLARRRLVVAPPEDLPVQPADDAAPESPPRGRR
jgi:16S rRNA processing protein RimM